VQLRFYTRNLMEPIIRSAIESDATGVNNISKYLGYSELSDIEAKHKLLQLLHSNDNEVFVVEVNGRVIAWLHLFLARRLASEDFFEIGGLVVDPDYRRQGLAGALLRYVENRHNGKLRVRCNETRRETHQFYEACGFNNTKAQRIFEIRA